MRDAFLSEWADAHRNREFAKRRVSESESNFARELYSTAVEYERTRMETVRRLYREWQSRVARGVSWA